MISKNQIKFIRSLDLKKNRKRESLFVAEGPKVIEELLKLKTPHTIIATKEWIDNNPKISNVIEVSERELESVSLLKTPQQVLALFAIETTVQDLNIDNNKLYLALDGIQDPGNLGTIIRIADWFGIDTIYCSNETVDVYNPKVIQATMGSIARVKVIYTDLYNMISYLSDEMPVYGTFLDGSDIYQNELTPNGIIVMGNEGKGITKELKSLITNKLLIPSFSIGDTAESLNVAIATAITCSEFKRR